MQVIDLKDIDDGASRKLDIATRGLESAYELALQTGGGDRRRSRTVVKPWHDMVYVSEAWSSVAGRSEASAAWRSIAHCSVA